MAVRAARHLRTPSRTRTRIVLGAWLALQLAAPPATHAGEYRSLFDGLEATLYVPEPLSASPALVVALHGCNQEASDYDDETGWTALADELGFLLLLPQQGVTNNPMRCFNWMLPGHRERGRGEPAAVMALVDEVQADYPVDASRLFVTGLSAGGAMAAVLLATYPERFAAGAVIAGLPYRCVTTRTTMASVQAATVCMSQGNRLVEDAQEWARRVRAASDYAGERWPRVSIWYGSDDTVVDPINAVDLMRQWTAVHGADQEPDATEETEGYVHRVYRDTRGQAVVELWEVKDLGHAVPIDEETECGVDSGGGFLAWFMPWWGEDYVEDVGLCASRRIARFWGLQTP
ncbi:MAG: PHB depolymerase family esterase [Gammaproteobacteria bacterium]|nr:PHB depolymerase family esterase [Gammaproteobacteria bacterium]NIR83241.1 PHB depolymerase family esterase [Gammaproteobacteria bacterium]NIR91045.1 PHB depolymerase family esterase [Gammaproteobacteria bacterium]NIU04406.1 PHB depolymerase family esterase [Gammaproteobacteria bacterium]NIV76361.1 PHB depolymerase family esterase [Gammaproteobacteria bacterium]